MSKIEKVTGTISRQSLMHLSGSPYRSSEEADTAAQHAAADGYSRVVIQKVGAKRLQEGRSMDEDDHWVAAPGYEYFVWGDEATYRQKAAASRDRIDAMYATERAEALAKYADALTAYQSTPHTGFVMTGTRFAEAMRAKGHAEVVVAAIAAKKLDELRTVVCERNANR